MKVKLPNRYGNNNRIHINQEAQYFTVEIRGIDRNYCRFGMDNDNNLSFFDPPGGPMISVGAKLGEYVETHYETLNEAVITKITQHDEELRFYYDIHKEHC